MYDIDAHKRGVGHTTVDCSGGTTVGRRCKRFQWFAKDKAPERWYCHDHKDQS